MRLGIDLGGTRPATAPVGVDGGIVRDAGLVGPAELGADPVGAGGV